VLEAAEGSGELGAVLNETGWISDGTMALMALWKEKCFSKGRRMARTALLAFGPISEIRE